MGSLFIVLLSLLCRRVFCCTLEGSFPLLLFLEGLCFINGFNDGALPSDHFGLDQLREGRLRVPCFANRLPDAALKGAHIVKREWQLAHLSHKSKQSVMAPTLGRGVQTHTHSYKGQQVLLQHSHSYNDKKLNKCYFNVHTATAKDQNSPGAHVS